MAQESQAEEQQLILGAVWIEGKGEDVGGGNGVAGDCISISLSFCKSDITFPKSDVTFMQK